MSEAERGLEGCPGVFLFLFLKMGGAFQPTELSESLPTIGDTRSDVSESLPQVGGNRSGVSESLPQVGGNLSGRSESLPQVGGSRSEHIDRICRFVFYPPAVAESLPPCCGTRLAADFRHPSKKTLSLWGMAKRLCRLALLSV